MSEYHDFEEYLSEADRWESRLEEVIHEVVWEEGEKITFDDRPDAQRAGIDIALTERDFEGIQLKVRAPKYCCDDVFIETVSVVEQGKPGWVYTYDETLVIYCWLNRARNNLQDGVLLLINDDFRLWFDGIKQRYREPVTKKPSIRNGREWNTKGCIVPIDDIPRGFIRTVFDPKLPSEVVTDQMELSEVSS